jgi:ABC-type nitrate/sulfonate/bicarbonate transport system substrate-binding protein
VDQLRFGIFSGDNARIMFGPLWIGLDRGYFTEAGVAVEVVVSDVRIGAADDPIDLECSSVGDLARRAVAGVGVVSIASQEQWRDGRGLTPLCTRRELIDRGELAADFASVRGKRIGVETGGSDRLGQGKMRPEPDFIYVHHILKRAGLSLDDVTLVNARHSQAFRDLENREVDLINAPRPRAVVQGEDAGWLARWKEAWEVAPRQGRSCIVKRDFAEQHPEAVQGFVTGWIRGGRDYLDAIVKGQGREAIIDLLVRHSGEARRVVERMSPLGVNPDGRVDVTSMQHDADLWAEHGLIDGRAEMAHMVDMSFVDRAREQLGPYRWP